MSDNEPIFNMVLADKRLEGWTYTQLTAVSGLSASQVRSRIEKYLASHGHGPR